MVYSKINAGKVRKRRGKHNLSHNVTTSQDFGIVMPYLCKMSSPQSSFRYSLDEKIRVMPMALPPFGSAKHHIYGQYVPLDSLWKAYGAFISQQPYATPFGNYTPSTTPHFRVGFNPVDSASESGLIAEPSLMQVFFSSAFTVSSLYVVSKDSTFDNLEFYNASDNNPSGPGIAISSSGTVNGLGSSISLAYSLNDYFGLGQTTPYSGFVAPDTPLPLFDRHFKPFCLDTFVNVGYNTASNSGESHQYNRISSMFHANTVGIGLHNGLTAQESNLYGISFESSDFQFLIPITYGSEKGKYKYLVCYKLNATGRRLYSILKSLGYDLNICSDNQQSPYKMLAYYKAWFDTFYPSRSRQWEQTYAARQCELWCDRGAVDILAPETWYFQDSSFVSDSTAVLNFYVFLRDELCQTYATSDPDYFTSSVLSSNNEKQPLNLSLAGAGEYPSGSVISQFPEDDVARVDKRSVLYPTSGTVNVSVKTSSNQSYFTVQALQAALKFSKFVGTNNIIGSSIHKFLKSHFGVEGACEETNFVGASVVPVEFGDVITTADTETGSTGDYSGVGYGSGSVHFNYHSPKDNQSVGYFLVFGAIIPPSNYSQGYDMENDIVTRFQYPFPEFDSLGYEPVKKGQLFTRSSAEPFTAARKPFVSSSLFGYQPRYLGLKVKNSVFSGDFACPSTMVDYLGFTFSNYITQDVRSYYEKTGATASTPKWVGSIVNPHESEFVVSPEWRFLGKHPWRTNFGRIFKDRQIYGYNTNKRILNHHFQYTDVDMTLFNLIPHYDPFIISMNVEFFVTNNLEPISDSYEIIDGLDNYVKHE